MKHPILILIPTRDRPHRLKRFLNTLELHDEGNSQVVVGVDQDQVELYNETVSHSPIVTVLVTQNEDFGPKLNYMYNAIKDVMMFEYVYVLGDDFEVESEFESEFLKSAKNKKLFMGFGDDGIKGESLATAMFMSRNIPDALGHLNPPTLTHLYCDNYWTDLGKALNCLYYILEVKMSHKHFTKYPELKDRLYEQSNSSDIFRKDELAYYKYRENNLKIDVDKILNYKP